MAAGTHQLEAPSVAKQFFPLSTRGAVGFARHPRAISSAFGSTKPKAGGIIIRVSGVRVPPPACRSVASFGSRKRETQVTLPELVANPGLRLTTTAAATSVTAT